MEKPLALLQNDWNHPPWSKIKSDWMDYPLMLLIFFVFVIAESFASVQSLLKFVQDAKD